MRAIAGESASAGGAYRCACCSQRHFVTEGAMIERCAGCECSIFYAEFRTIAVEPSLEHRRNFALPL
jgi:hypothetical protein